MGEDDEGHLFCQEENNLSYEVCNMLEYYDCKWVPQKDCPNEVRKQDIVDSPVGCCYKPNYSEPDNLFGTTASFHFDLAAVDSSGKNYPSWDYDSGEVDEMIPGVLCGEGKYVEHVSDETHPDQHEGGLRRGRRVPDHQGWLLRGARGLQGGPARGDDDHHRSAGAARVRRRAATRCLARSLLSLPRPARSLCQPSLG